MTSLNTQHTDNGYEISDDTGDVWYVITYRPDNGNACWKLNFMKGAQPAKDHFLSFEGAEYAALSDYCDQLVIRAHKALANS